MSNQLKVGDRVRYTGPILLGTRWEGVIERLEVPHVRDVPRRVLDDRIMLRVANNVPGCPAHRRAARREELEKIS